MYTGPVRCRTDRANYSDFAKQHLDHGQSGWTTTLAIGSQFILRAGLKVRGVMSLVQLF
jgi:hypothetical protein